MYKMDYSAATPERPQPIISRLLLLIGLIVFFAAREAYAATLNFSPSSGSFAAQSRFSVTVFVSTPDQAINALGGTITFPTESLEVVSLSKTGSVINLWAQEPAFSNNAGTVTFEGIALNPGYTGAFGKVFTITFRAKTTGSASVSFLSGSVLANDGQGTNILGGLGRAAFVMGAAAPDATTPGGGDGTPAAPVISSPTHSDPEKWYAARDAEFTWVPLPSGIRAARLLVGKIPKVIPTVVYDPAVSSKKLEDLGDGRWYFHVQLKNDEGWGDVVHFRFQIDTLKPTRFEITAVERKDATLPTTAFRFEAEDETSGIDHYEIQLDSAATSTWSDDGGGIYTTEVLRPGRHTLYVKAVDKAGNFLPNSLEFAIEPLDPPSIDEYPREVESDEVLTLKGKTKYAEANVEIYFKKGEGEAKFFLAAAQADGTFSLTSQKELTDGVYSVWAEVVDGRGARSTPSERVTITVRPTPLVRVSRGAITFFAVVIPLLALVLFLGTLVWYWWHALTRLKKKVRREAREAEDVLHKVFDSLKENIRTQLKLLEKTKSKRALTEEEGKVLQELKHSLDEAEHTVRKEIEEIEGEAS